MGNKCNGGPKPRPPGPNGKPYTPKLKEEDHEKSAKIIIMGNSQVGKTSIVKAYMESQSQRGKQYVRTNTV